jgi:hypothetical protein
MSALGTFRTCRDVRLESVVRAKADIAALLLIRHVGNVPMAAPAVAPKSRFSVMGSNETNPEDADWAFAALFELFSKPTKSTGKAYRTYELSFENGEPVFTLSEADRILEGVFGGMFDRGEVE